MHALVRLWRLARNERLLLAKAFALLVVARVGLLILPASVLIRLFARSQPPCTAIIPPALAFWAVNAAAGRIPGTHCLARSLALMALLRGAGHALELQIGVAKRATGGIVAHAWVLCNGEPLHPYADLGDYLPFQGSPTGRGRMKSSMRTHRPNPTVAHTGSTTP